MMRHQEFTRRRPPRRKPDFTLTIVKIVFLLVLFFLVAGTLVKRAELTIDLARTETLPLDRLPRPLLALAAGGQVFLDGEAISAADALAGLSDTGAVAVHILAEAGAPAQMVLAWADRIAATGMTAKLVTLHQRRKPAP